MFSPPVETEGGVCCGDWRRGQWTLRGQRTDLWHNTTGQGENLTDLPAQVWLSLPADQGYRNRLVNSLFLTLSLLMIIIFHKTSLKSLRLLLTHSFRLPVAISAKLIPVCILCFMLCTQSMKRKESLSCYRKLTSLQRFGGMLQCWTL